jgi:PAS domain S-box-containing protein
MLIVPFVAPHYPGMQVIPIEGMIVLALGFAVSGARLTLAARQRLDDAQAQLAESEKQYRVLADNVTDVIGLSDFDRNWHYISPSVKQVLGYTAEELLPMATVAHIHPDDVVLLTTHVDALVAGGAARMVEYRATRKDGSMTWIETNFSLVYDPQTRQASQLVSISRDIAPRKTLERELIESKERAEAATAAKSDFLANMTHELRTPLNAIIGFSGILRNSATLSAQDGRYATLINEASATLLGVINSVLDFSKLEAGALEVDTQPFDPINLVESVVMLVHDQAKDKGLYLRIQTTGEPGSVVGDALRIRQVLLNLLSNALKFTAEGGVNIRIETHEVDPGFRRLRIVVEDTGIGISAAQLPAVFERFTQADVSVSRRFGGTGLGMAISKRLVELMGGTIEVASTEGTGSTFAFELTLPIGKSETATDEIQAEPMDIGRPLRLLLVEDVDINRELVRILLKPFDIDLDTAVNGQDAIEAVKHGQYDVVLMDVQMPVMDGLTATRHIRALTDPTTKRVPIIAMTAHVLPEHIEQCRNAGMNDHLGKPIDAAKLLSVLTRWALGGEAKGRLGSLRRREAETPVGASRRA